MKNIISCALIAAIILSVSGCSGGDGVNVKLTGDKLVTADRGDVLYVNLDANPTTGYVWQIAGEYDEDMLRRIGKFGYKHNSDRLGAGGIQTFRFEALKKGRTAIAFEYKRPWEKDVKAEKKYTLRIIVH